MKLMVKFYLQLIAQFHCSYFLSFPRKIVFGVIKGNYLHLKHKENVKELWIKILKKILVPDFCLWNYPIFCRIQLCYL